MPSGSMHIDYNCPGCGKTFRSSADHAGREAECPECGTDFSIPAAVPEPAAPARSRYADRIAPEAEGVPPKEQRETGRRIAASRRRARADGDPARWASRWALIWGAILLFAVVVPRPYEKATVGSGYGLQTETGWAFFLDPPGDDIWPVVANLAAVGLGVLAIVAGIRMAGRRLGPTLFLPAAAVFLLYFVLDGVYRVLGVGEGEAGAVAAVALLLSSTPLIAAGNHARKLDPDRSIPRRLAGVGGVLLVVAFLLPVFNGHPLIESFFLDAAWSQYAGVLVAALALLAYGCLGVASFTSGRKGNLTLTISILARCIMIGLPIVILLTGQAKDRAGDVGIQFIRLLAGFLALYALLALAATGLAAWIGCESDEPPVASPRRDRSRQT